MSDDAILADPPAHIPRPPRNRPAASHRVGAQALSLRYRNIPVTLPPAPWLADPATAEGRDDG